VVLVGEIHQPRRHAFQTQRVVVFEALRHRHAVVIFAVRDEGRRLEVGGEALRRLLVDLLEVAPRRVPS
jgi:hypothetical protein